MSGIDGFVLLEIVRRETDLPVVMISGDIRISLAIKGIQKGAYDFLTKPFDISELKNIWRHVIRRKCRNFRSGKIMKFGHNIKVTNVAITPNIQNNSSWQSQEKNICANEHNQDGELGNKGATSSRKPRFVWSAEVHQKFVDAVNQIGLERAVPRTIIELMNVPGITREIVASHLQKYRIYARRAKAYAERQDGNANLLCPNPATNTNQLPQQDLYGTNLSYHHSATNASQLPQQDLYGLAAPTRVPLQDCALLHLDNLSYEPCSFPLSSVNQYTLLQESAQGTEPPVTGGFQFYNPLQTDDGMVPLQVYSSNDLGSVAPPIKMWESSTSQNSNMLAPIAQQQQSHLDSSFDTVGVQSSFVVASNESPEDFNVQGHSMLLNQHGATDSFFLSPNALVGPSSTSVGNSPASQIQGPEVFPPQPFTCLQETTPHIINQGSVGNYFASQVQGPEVFSSQPLTGLQETTPHIIDQSSVFAPSMLSDTFMEENNLDTFTQNEHFSNSQGFGFPPSWNMDSTSMIGGFGSHFGSVTNINNIPVPDFVPFSGLPYSDASNWQMQFIDSNFGHHDLQSSLIPGTLNAGDTNGLFGNLPGLGQGSSSVSLYTHTFPSRFDAEGIESLVSDSNNIAHFDDENYIINQSLPPNQWNIL